MKLHVKSDAQRVNSHNTPNYEKTFDAPNQRPYHFQTVKLLFLVKQNKKEGEGLAEKDLQHCCNLPCVLMNVSENGTLRINELISINLVGVRAIALTKKNMTK